MTIYLCLIAAIVLLAVLLLASRDVAGFLPVRMDQGLNAVSLGLIALAIITPGIWYRSDSYLGDLWTAFEAMHKTAQGLRANIDYFSPLGPVVEWVYALALMVRAPGATALVLANALVAALALGLCRLLLRDRASPLAVALAGIVAVTVALSPRDLDSLTVAAQSSFLAPYNRWAWALLVPVSLHASLDSRRTGWAATAVPAGLGVMLLLLLKVTYGMVVLGLYAAACLLKPARWRETAIVVATCGAAMLLADRVTGGQISAYGHDLALAARMPSNGLRIAKLMSEMPILLGVTGLCAVITAGAVRAAGEAPAVALRQHWRAAVQTALLGGGGMLIIMQNHYSSEATTLLLMPIIMAQETGLLGAVAAPRRELPQPGAEWLALVMLVILAMPAIDAGFIMAQQLQVRRKAPLDLFAGSELRDVKIDGDYIAAPGASCSGGTCADVQRLAAGKALLERHCPARSKQAVLALNFSNPFPALLNTPSPKASPIWLHLNRSFSEQSHLPAEQLFAGVGCVLVARNEPNAAALALIYRDALAQRFRLTAANAGWDLYIAAP